MFYGRIDCKLLVQLYLQRKETTFWWELKSREMKERDVRFQNLLPQFRCVSWDRCRPCNVAGGLSFLLCYFGLFFCCDILQRFSRHDKIIIFKLKMLPSTTIILIHKIVYSEWSRIIQWLSRQGQLMSVISPFWSSVLESNPEKNGRRRCHVKKTTSISYPLAIV